MDKDYFKSLSQTQLQELSSYFNEIMKERETELFMAVVNKDIKTCKKALSLMQKLPKNSVSCLKELIYSKNDASFITLFLDKLEPTEKSEVLKQYFTCAIKDVEFFNQIKDNPEFHKFIQKNLTQPFFVDNVHSDVLMPAIEASKTHFKLNHFEAFISNSQCLFRLFDNYPELADRNKDKIYSFASKNKSVLIGKIADKLEIEKSANLLCESSHIARTWITTSGNMDFFSLICNEFKFDHDPQKHFPAQMQFLYHLPELEEKYWHIAIEGLIKNHKDSKDFLNIMEDRIYMDSYSNRAQKEKFKNFAGPLFQKLKLQYTLPEKFSTQKIKL